MVLGLHLHDIPIKKEKISFLYETNAVGFYGSITKSVGNLEMLSGGVVPYGTLQGSDL